LFCKPTTMCGKRFVPELCKRRRDYSEWMKANIKWNTHKHQPIKYGKFRSAKTFLVLGRQLVPLALVLLKKNVFTKAVEGHQWLFTRNTN
jgi:hypothetical protein